MNNAIFDGKLVRLTIVDPEKDAEFSGEMDPRQ